MKKVKTKPLSRNPGLPVRGRAEQGPSSLLPPAPSLKEAKGHPLLPLSSPLFRVSLLQVDYMDFELVTEESRKRSSALILTELTKFKGFLSQPRTIRTKRIYAVCVGAGVGVGGRNESSFIKKHLGWFTCP